MWKYEADSPKSSCLPENRNQFLESCGIQPIFSGDSILSHEIARDQTFLQQPHLVPTTSMELNFKMLFGSERQTEHTTQTQATHRLGQNTWQNNKEFVEESCFRL